MPEITGQPIRFEILNLLLGNALLAAHRAHTCTWPCNFMVVYDATLMNVSHSTHGQQTPLSFPTEECGVGVEGLHTPVEEESGQLASPVRVVESTVDK